MALRSPFRRSFTDEDLRNPPPSYPLDPLPEHSRLDTSYSTSNSVDQKPNDGSFLAIDERPISGNENIFPHTTVENENVYQSYAHTAPDDSSFLNVPLLDARPRQKKTLLAQLGSAVSFLVGILWLAPAIALIYLNLVDHVVGASAWCPWGNCRVMTYQVGDNVEPYAQKAVQATKNDRMLVGILQFVAKALEVWFGFIAAGLVYQISCVIARRKGGLPLGYVLTHLEFADLRALFSRNTWLTATDGRPKSLFDREHHTRYLFGFTLLAAALCVITNLMGPSIAVLILPTLDWSDTTYRPINISSLSSPYLDSVFAPISPTRLPKEQTIPGCKADQLYNGLTDCTSGSYSRTFDALVETSMSILAQENTMKDTRKNLINAWDNTMHAPSSEFWVPFSFNLSADITGFKRLGPQWAPNRQVLREMAFEFKDVHNVIDKGNVSLPYAKYNSSLELQIQRQGPILGFNYSLSTTGTFYSRSYGPIDANGLPSKDKYSACVIGYATYHDKSYSKCWLVGKAWDDSFSHAQMNVGSVNSSMLLMFASTNKMFYFEGNSTNLIPACMKNDDPWSDCDWTQPFTFIPGGEAALPPDLKDLLQPNTLAGFYVWSTDGDNGMKVQVTEYYPFTGLATYSLDVTTISPSMNEVKITELPQLASCTNVSLNADWMLAAWSARTANGDVPNDRRGGVRDSRPAARSLLRTFGQLMDLDDTELDNDAATRAFSNIVMFSGLQALSMVPYSTLPTSTTNKALNEHPLLTTWFHQKVWKFGLGDSKTKRLGVVVMVFGILTVVARSVLFVVARSREHSTAQVVASALSHVPRNEFGGVAGDRELSRMRFVMKDRDVDDFVVFKKVQ